MEGKAEISPEERRRRKILLATTASLGTVGLVAALYPFLASMAPSEAAKAAGAPVRFDVTTLAPGALATVEWRGRPIWILHRSEAMLAELNRHAALLVDPASSQPQQPAYAKNPYRSIRPDFLVITGICTHLGCIPLYRPDAGTAELGGNWPGGFYCPCHGSRFDLAGRVFKNVPAPLNLEVPAHTYLNEAELLIGADSKGA